MPIFELLLQLHPSFHRKCSIRIMGDDAGIAIFEAPATGLFPHTTLTLPVESDQLAALYGYCSNMLATWDKRWSKAGLDGIGVDGTFDASDSKPQVFQLRNPDKNSAAHIMLSAAFECFPPERCDEVTRKLLEDVKSYFGLQAPARVPDKTPLRIDLSRWMRAYDVREIRKRLRLLPKECELVIDTSGMKHLSPELLSALPIPQQQQRSGTVRWVTRSAHIVEALLASGVELLTIDVIPQAFISPHGYPIVLGGLAVSSAEILTLADDGQEREVVQAFRKEYSLTIEQASQATEELLDVIAAYKEGRISPVR